jgi:DNA-binding PadR family transcriptional regulator
MSPDIENKRNLLSVTRVRFAPSVQKVKEAATDHVVEQALRAFDDNVRPTPEQIQRSIQTWGKIRIAITDVNNALNRLVENGRISEVEETKKEVKGQRKKHYALLEDAKKELDDLEREAVLKNKKTRFVFLNNVRNHAKYCLSLEPIETMFSKLNISLRYRFITVYLNFSYDRIWLIYRHI